MRVIYEPRGKAFEYSPLALNLYNGCAHGCKYCYGPSATFKSREAFQAKPQPRPHVLDNLRKDVASLAGDPRPVLMCFTSDPYQPIEAEHRITRQAIEIMGEAGIKMAVLTKNGPLAYCDFDLFKKYDVAFGTTLLFTSEADRQEWEPNAASIIERKEIIICAKAAGIRTWVSIEPVIDTSQALQLLDTLESFVDVWKVGKLNHDKAREDKINWKTFLEQVLMWMQLHQANYYIKDDLWAFADKGIAVPRSRGVEIFKPTR